MHSEIMTRYFFNLRNRLSVDDEEGTELPNLQAACARANEMAIDMVAALANEEGAIDLDHRIEVVDANKVLIYTARFGDVVRVTQAGQPLGE